ncbi:hypothetical protein [Spirosoma linguale]|uniref:Uncharacterized protein n=1 Tax=Spirosoma linguale (strain ATCC 33905 / DSM 74 / LMG 10896 / Claus 1) TaxID=504472 RepID=D2QIC8_SPILD|nr:hypothetical protein Slin_2696 [Spirosoma linguale DSM 74]
MEFDAYQFERGVFRVEWVEEVVKLRRFHRPALNKPPVPLKSLANALGENRYKRIA